MLRSLLELLEFNKDAKQDISQTEGARRIEANLCSCFHEATEGRNFRRVLSVASFHFSPLLPKLLHVQPAPVTISFRGLLMGLTRCRWRHPSGGPDMDLWGTPSLRLLTCLLTWTRHLASLGNVGATLLQHPLLEISSLWPYQKKFEFQIFVFFYRVSSFSVCLKPAKYTHTLFIYYSLACILLP